MGRAVSIIYGVLIIVLALLTWIPLISDSLLFFLVIALGAVILLTPVGDPANPAPFIRRVMGVVTGLYLLVSGLASVFGFFPEYTSRITLDSSVGSIIMLALGIIYLLSATVRGYMPIRTN